MHVYQNTKRHTSEAVLKHTKLLYRTVTAENAAKHIVASIIRKWPHRETLSASSSCCMNLWIKRTSSKYIFVSLRYFLFLVVYKSLFLFYKSEKKIWSKCYHYNCCFTFWNN